MAHPLAGITDALGQLYPEDGTYTANEIEMILWMHEMRTSRKEYVVDVKTPVRTWSDFFAHILNHQYPYIITVLQTCKIIKHDNSPSLNQIL